MKTFREMNESLSFEEVSNFMSKNQKFCREVGHSFLTMLQDQVHQSSLESEDLLEIMEQFARGETVETEGNLTYNNVATVFGAIASQLRGKVHGEKFNF
jgi:hypothetical protein